jgi:membrane protein
VTERAPGRESAVAPPEATPALRRGRARRLVAATAIAVPAFSRHAGSQFAAAISYRVLFSLVPFAALVVSLADLLLPDSQSRRVDDWIHGLSPVSGELGASIDRTLSQSGTTASMTGIVALVGLLWGASAMAASIRAALVVVWGADRRRPYVRGKIVDLAVVLFGVAFVLAAFVVNVGLQLVTTAGTELADDAGLERVDASILGVVGGALATYGLLVAALLVIYRLPAPTGRPLGELLPGALVGAFAAQLAIFGFSLYVGKIADFDAIYGALSGIFGFLFLVYLIASTIVLGAEVAAAWPAAAVASTAPAPPGGLRRRLALAVRGLAGRDRDGRGPEAQP